MRELQVALRVAMEGQGVATSGGAAAGATFAGTAAQAAPSAPPAARGAGTPSSVSATTTTFRTGTGEVVSSAVGPVTRGAAAAIAGAGPPRRRSMKVAAGAMAAVAVSVLALVALRKREPAAVLPLPRSTAAAVSQPSPAAAAAAAPAPDNGVARRENPVTVAPVEHAVRLESQPPGAQVSDARSGAVLGTTPLAAVPNDGEQPLELRLSKEGFADVVVSIPPRQDGERTVILGSARSRAGGRGRRDQQQNGRATAAKAETHQRLTAAGAPTAVSPPAASPAATGGAASRGKAAPEKW